MTTTITATVPEGNFETLSDARVYAAAFEAAALEAYPDARVTVTVIARQHGGSETRVVIDGNEDEVAAEWLRQNAEARAF